MNLLTVLFFFNIAVTAADIDCSDYKNDLEAANINPFYISTYYNPSRSSFSYDERERIAKFYIYNDGNPSSSIYCLTSLTALTLVNTNLTILSDIKNFQQLNSLIIQGDNGIIDQHLPPEFGRLASLSTLELTDIRNLEDLPDSIGYLTQLQALILTQMPNFNTIPSTFGNMTNLRTVNLNQLPRLSSLPKEINNLQYLHDVEITNTSINPLQLDSLSNLYSLQVQYNTGLETIQISNMLALYSLQFQRNNDLLTLNLKNLPNLQSLTISANNKLNSITVESLSSMAIISIKDSAQLKTMTVKNLTALSIFELAALPNLESISFEDLPNLSSITIKNSPQLKSISFKNVPSLLALDLSGCQLREIPQSILELKLLRSLILTSNQLSQLPPSLATDLPNLQVLRLENNQLSGNFFQLGLTYLVELYLTNNLFTSIDNIDQYRSLKKLTLDYNRISSIPITIMKLSPTLTTLAIDFNMISRIPYSMTNMRTLKSFSVTNNQIAPEERSYLISLFSKTPIFYQF